jgi:hypothetical protein
LSLRWWGKHLSELEVAVKDGSVGGADKPGVVGARYCGEEGRCC